MNLPVLEIPDDPLDWPLWLEDRLLGNDLGDLVEQLTSVLDKPASEPTLEEICGDALPRVLQQGLSVLTAEDVRKLLGSPQLLLDLQERILSDGGSYWMVKIDAAEPEAGEHRWQKLQPLLGLKQAAPAIAAPPPSRTGRRWLLVSAGSLAAAALVAAVVWRPSPPEPEPKGWNRPGFFAVDKQGIDYLKHLAAPFKDWPGRRLETAADLKAELEDLRRGCDVCLNAPHLQLSDEQREELYRRCRNWATAFDNQLQALRDGKSADEVRQETEKTINKLIDALNRNFPKVSLNREEGFPGLTPRHLG